ncbi:MAG: hypothetical protein AAFO99_09020 [Bacteroidota bacterium]
MSLKPGADNKAKLDDYFMKIGEVIMASGAKVHSFAVTKASVGDGPAQMFLIGEYPDREAPRKIFESEAFFKNRNQRDHALSYLSEGFFMATADGEFDLSQGGLRLYSLWTKKGKEEQLNSYFNTIMPYSMETGAVPAPFVFVPDPSIQRQSNDASMVFLGSWSEEGEKKFYGSKLFKENVAKRDDALNFLEEYEIMYIPEQAQ